MDRRSRLSAAVVLVGLLTVPTASRAAAVGTLPGDLTTDPTGAVTYSIPLDVPPGVAGLTPKLSLNYSSRSGNGTFGVGWSVGGLSTISRCPQTKATDGVFGASVTLQSTDRFCLDGQRLVVADPGATYGGTGVEYRTELESFQAVWSNGVSGTGPTWFRVLDKAGFERHYGNGGNSRIEAKGQATVVIWALSRIQDRFGNYILFVYGENTGTGQTEYWPQSIAWFNRDSVELGRVNFALDAGRPDIATSYALGGSQLTKRIARIDVYGLAGTPKIREYRLDYETGTHTGLSHLRSVTQCNAALDCLNPTILEYDHGQVGFAAITQSSTAPSSSQLLDVNGDGRLDWVYPSGGTWRVRTQGLLGGTYNTGISAANYYTSNQYTHPIDVNGDGYQDLLVANSLSGKWDALQATPNGAGWTLTVVPTTVPHGGWYTYPLAVTDLDGDGWQDIVHKTAYEGAVKRLTLFKNTNGAGAFSAIPTQLPVMLNQKLQPVEWDGDANPELLVTMDGCTATPGAGGGGGGGCTGPTCEDPLAVFDEPWIGEEVVFSEAPMNSAISQAFGLQTTTFSILERNCADSAGTIDWNGSTLVETDHLKEVIFKKFVALDVNGDGLTDFAHGDNYALSNGNNPGVLNTWNLYLNVGGSLTHTWNGFNTSYHEYAVALDYNGDGRSDLFVPQNGYWQVLKSNAAGNGFLAAFPSNASSSGYQSTFVADADGNGLRDLQWYGSKWEMRHQSGDRRGHLSQVTNGLGAVSKATYDFLSLDSASFDGTTTAGVNSFTSQFRHLLAPIYVAATLSVDNGRGSGSAREYVHTHYRYKGSKLDVWGRGFLGFESIAAQNANSQSETVTHYRQDWPYTGMILSNLHKRQDVSVAPYQEGQTWTPPTTLPGNPILEIVNTLNAKAHATSQFPYVSRTVETDKDPMTGNEFRSRETVYTYANYGTPANNYGNPTKISVTVRNAAGDTEHTVVTTNVYQDLLAEWCLGRLTSTSVTHKRFSGPSSGSLVAQTRTASFTYDPITCQLESETVGGQPVLRTDYAYDVYGNRISAKAGANLAASKQRLTSTGYDGRGLSDQRHERARTPGDPRLG